MKKYLIILIFFSCNPQLSSAGSRTPAYYKKRTNKGYVYKDENKIACKRKILIFSYGSLVKQKENKKTGDILCASTFEKTSLQVPISFTFLAEYPHYPTRRATVTLDAQAKEMKNIWWARSDFAHLGNARNNLAAREGSAFKNSHEGYDNSNIFYIKRLHYNHKNSRELSIPGFPGWVSLRARYKHQQMPTPLLQSMVQFVQEHNADAAIWAALPSNGNEKMLNNLIEKDPVFVANTYRYIEKLPPGNTLTNFEKAVIEQYKKTSPPPL